jgi:hypothetical protein
MRIPWKRHRPEGGGDNGVRQRLLILAIDVGRTLLALARALLWLWRQTHGEGPGGR